MITVDVPISNMEPVFHSPQTGQSCLSSEFTFQRPGFQPGSQWNLSPQINTTTPHPVAPMAAGIRPDGLLLYVSEASFEPGTSPLSSWIPIEEDSRKGRGEVDLEEEEEGMDVKMSGEKPSGSLDLFQWFVS